MHSEKAVVTKSRVGFVVLDLATIKRVLLRAAVRFGLS